MSGLCSPYQGIMILYISFVKLSSASSSIMRSSSSSRTHAVACIVIQPGHHSRHSAVMSMHYGSASLAVHHHVKAWQLGMQVGARWLSEWCARAQVGAAYGGSSDDALALAVSRVLLASKSADEAAAELFDLLGDGSFDAIQQILEHRYALSISHAKTPMP